MTVPLVRPEFQARLEPIILAHTVPLYTYLDGSVHVGKNQKKKEVGKERKHRACLPHSATIAVLSSR